MAVRHRLLPRGEDTLVTLGEHPLRRPGGLLHNGVVDALARVRHRAMLARLADVVARFPRHAARAA